MKLKSLTIKNQLSISIVLITALIILISSATEIYTGIKNYRKHLISTTTIETNLISDHLVYHLSHDFDTTSLNNVLLELNNIPNINFAAIYDNDSNLISSYTHSEFSGEIPKLNSKTNNYFTSTTYNVCQTISTKEKKYGTLCLSFSTLELKRNNTWLIIRSVVLFLVFLFIAFLLSYLVEKRFLRPILKLNNAFNNIKNLQNVNFNLKYPRNDEIGILYEGFNSMLTELNRSLNERDIYNLQLMQSEKKYRDMIENLPVAYYRVDTEGNLMGYNKLLCNIVGLDHNRDNTGVNIGNMWKDQKQRQQYIKLLNKNGQIKNFDVIGINQKTGLIQQIQLSAILTKDSNDRPLYIEGTFAEISDIKKAEQALKVSENKFRNLFEKSPAGIFVTDAKGKCIDVNQNWTKLTGLSKKEALGDGWINAVYEDDRENIFDLWQKYARNADKWNHEFRYRNLRTNEIIWIWSVSSPLRDENNNIIGFIGINTDINERKLMLKALEKNNEKYLQMFEGNQAIKLIIDQESDRIIEANKTAAEFYGYAVNVLCEMNISEINILSDEEIELEKRKAKKEKRIYFNYKHKTADGTIKDVEVYTGPVIIDKNTFIYAIINDVTEKRKTEKLVEETKQHYQSMFTYSPVPLWEEDFSEIVKYFNKLKEKGITDGRKYLDENPDEILKLSSMIKIIDVNRAAIKLHKAKSKKELIDNFDKIFTPQSLITFKNEMIAIWNNKKDFQTTGVVKTLDGQTRHIMLSLSLEQKSNSLYRALVATPDITAHQRSQLIKEMLFKIIVSSATTENLKELAGKIRDELSQIFDTTNFYIALYNETTDTFDLPYFTDLYESSNHIPSGLTMTHYVLKTRKPILAKHKDFEKLQKQGKVELYGQDSKVWLGTPLISGGKEIGVLAMQNYTSEDAYTKDDLKLLEIISEQLSAAIYKQQTEEELKIALKKAKEAEVLKTSFLQNMSHEIRTPMNGIIGFANLLRNPLLSGEEQDNYVNLILNSSKRLLGTLNDLMDISMLETEQVKTNFSDFNLSKEMDILYEFFAPEARQKGLKFNYTSPLSYKEAQINSDFDKWYAIMVNLIKNAIKYTLEGSIEFGYLKTGNELKFFVKDTGTGIPKSRQKAIFERFVQADLEDVKAFEGAGLGLSISKAYIEMIGGKIWVESEENNGSIFYFTMPYKKAEVIEEDIIEVTPTVKVNLNLENSKLKVLIAEDEQTSDDYLSIILEDFSSELLHVKDGNEAVEICKQNPDLDLIMMDIKMPQKGGYVATREIRQFNKNVIIIAQTAYALRGDREKALFAGCNDYITKPIDPDELFDLLAKYFKG